VKFFWRFVAFAICVGVACAPIENPPRDVATPDFDWFVCQVHPKMQAHCSMGACHGNEQMILRVHSLGLLRMNVPDGGIYTTTYRFESPLTREELTADYNSLRTLIDPNNVAGSAPLRKPLGAAYGGGWHGGGVIYADTNDLTYTGLLQWMNGATTSQLSSTDLTQCQRVLQLSLSL
jgi:hypothetical protein